jgi:hypothetical protein
MHDRGDVASNALVDIFRKAEQVASKYSDPARRNADNSKDCQMKRLGSDHDAAASNEGCCP